MRRFLRLTFLALGLILVGLFIGKTQYDLHALAESVNQVHAETYACYMANQTLGETNATLLKQRDALKALLKWQQTELGDAEKLNRELGARLLKQGQF